MKKISLKSSLLAGIFSLLLLLPSFLQGDLKDITKPYLGVYECIEATLNGEDFLDKYDYISIELKDNGKFLLYMREAGKKQRKMTGKYTYDREKQEFRVNGSGNVFKRKFTLQEGVLNVYLQIGSKNLLLKFEQK